MKVIAALSAFPFMLLAVIFGINASPDQTDSAATALSILSFIAGTSLILGIVFDHSALSSVTVSGGRALLIM